MIACEERGMWGRTWSAGTWVLVCGPAHSPPYSAFACFPPRLIGIKVQLAGKLHVHVSGRLLSHPELIAELLCCPHFLFHPAKRKSILSHLTCLEVSWFHLIPLALCSRWGSMLVWVFWTCNLPGNKAFT